VQGAFLLDVVVAQYSAVLERFACEDESLLVDRDSFFVLYLAFHSLDAVAVFDFESDGLSCEGSNEDLHSSPESEDEVQGAFLLDVVVSDSPSIFQVFPSEDEPLLVDRDSFFVLYLGFHIFNGISLAHVESHRLSSQSSYEYLLHLLLFLWSILLPTTFIRFSSDNFLLAYISIRNTQTQYNITNFLQKSIFSFWTSDHSLYSLSINFFYILDNFWDLKYLTI